MERDIESPRNLHEVHPFTRREVFTQSTGKTKILLEQNLWGGTNPFFNLVKAFLPAFGIREVLDKPQDENLVQGLGKS